jgi:hypothetical protein
VRALQDSTLYSHHCESLTRQYIVNIVRALQDYSLQSLLWEPHKTVPSTVFVVRPSQDSTLYSHHCESLTGQYSLQSSLWEPHKTVYSQYCESLTRLLSTVIVVRALQDRTLNSHCCESLRPDIFLFLKFLLEDDANYEMCCVVNQDSGDVWAPPHPQDHNSSYSAEKKSSHFWQSAPVTEWSKEQVFWTSDISYSILGVWLQVEMSSHSIKSITSISPPSSCPLISIHIWSCATFGALSEVPFFSVLLLCWAGHSVA